MSYPTHQQIQLCHPTDKTIIDRLEKRWHEVDVLQTSLNRIKDYADNAEGDHSFLVDDLKCMADSLSDMQCRIVEKINAIVEHHKGYCVNQQY